MGCSVSSQAARLPRESLVLRSQNFDENEMEEVAILQNGKAGAIFLFVRNGA